MQITIITPVYNGAKYIGQCIDNVISQKCSSVEHLIMDGSSTDGTQEIAQKYTEAYPHIRLVSEKDSGQSDAMNKGITKAKGSIISFLNVDDYYEPNLFNRVLAVFKKLDKPAFVCGNLNIRNADGTLKHFNRPDRISLVELVSNCFEWPYNPSAYFYHKVLHEKIGYYNVANHLCMDYEFILEAAKFIGLTHIDETWGNFVMVDGSKTKIFHSEDPKKAYYEAEAIRTRFKNGFSPDNTERLSQVLLKQNQMHLPALKVSTSLLTKLRKIILSLKHF